MIDTPAPTRLSATVLLLRDTTDLEVLMVKRHYQIDFASGALVFPGGKANDEDADPAWSDLSDCDFEGDPLTARVAAAREAFEESGILLARAASERGVDKPLVGFSVQVHGDEAGVNVLGDLRVLERLLLHLAAKFTPGRANLDQQRFV